MPYCHVLRYHMPHHKFGSHSQCDSGALARKPAIGDLACKCPTGISPLYVTVVVSGGSGALARKFAFSRLSSTLALQGSTCIPWLCYWYNSYLGANNA